MDKFNNLEIMHAFNSQTSYWKGTKFIRKFMSFKKRMNSIIHFKRKSNIYPNWFNVKELKIKIPFSIGLSLIIKAVKNYKKDEKIKRKINYSIQIKKWWEKLEKIKTPSFKSLNKCFENLRFFRKKNMEKKSRIEINSNTRLCIYYNKKQLLNKLYESKKNKIRLTYNTRFIKIK